MQIGIAWTITISIASFNYGLVMIFPTGAKLSPLPLALAAIFFIFLLSLIWQFYAWIKFRGPEFMTPQWRLIFLWGLTILLAVVVFSGAMSKSPPTFNRAARQAFWILFVGLQWAIHSHTKKPSPKE